MLNETLEFKWNSPHALVYFYASKHNFKCLMKRLLERFLGTASILAIWPKTCQYKVVVADKMYFEKTVLYHPINTVSEWI